MKDRKIQEKEKINMQLKNKRKLQKLKEKGITLIALVVTIIILLILAGVTLNMALSGDGLFSRARNTADKYKKAQKDEQELISEIGKEMNSEYVGAYITGYTPTGGECTITGDQSGTGSDQEFNTENETKDENELKWRIWDYDGTTLRIILDRPTIQELKLKGANGYNNGVWAINEICRKCFGQYEEDNIKMKEGIKVSNLKRSDIQKVSIYNYVNYNHKDNDPQEVTENTETIKFGEIKTGKYKYPKIWGLNDRNWKYEYNKKNGVSGGDEECLLWENEGTSDGTIDGTIEEALDEKFKQSYYLHNYKRDEFKIQRYFDMIFTTNDNDEFEKFWLGGRYTFLGKNLTSDYCAFGLNIVSVSSKEEPRISGSDMLFTSGNEGMSHHPVRPVVTINLMESGYHLQKVDQNGDISFQLMK